MTPDEVVKLVEVAGYDPDAWRWVLERRGLSGSELTEAIAMLERVLTAEGLELPDGRLICRMTEGDEGMKTWGQRRHAAAVIAASTVDRAVDEEAAILSRRAEQRAQENEDVDAIEAARALGVPRREIVSIEQGPQGIVVTDHCGGQFIWVAPDRPDADGKTGGPMTFGATSPASRLPAYAFTPTPPAVDAAPEILTTFEVSEPAADDIDDETIVASLEAQLQSTEAELYRMEKAETAYPFPQPVDKGLQQLLKDSIPGLKRLIMMKRAAINDRELLENPPPPHDVAVKLNRGSYLLAQRALGPEKDRTRDLQRLIAAYPELYGIPLDETSAQRELEGARKFFAHHGLPLPDGEPAPAA